MKLKKILLFGGSGQIGCSLIRKLTQNDYAVTVVTRNIHQKGYALKTQGNAGWIDIVECSIFNEIKIRELLENTDICINLIGILYERGKVNNFKNIHEKFPAFLSNLCKEYKVKQFIHLSALGIEEAKDSLYAQSKLKGEIFIKENFKNAIILRPSVVYSSSDNFTTQFMSLINILPFFPIYYEGKTKFMPIFCSDLVNIIYQVITKEYNSMTIECVGSEEITLKEIIQRLLKSIEKKRFLLSMPLFLAKFSAKFFQVFPKPLLTMDQLTLLKYNNIPSGKFKTNFELNMPANANFDKELEKYSYMWKETGEYSKKKYRKNN